MTTSKTRKTKATIIGFGTAAAVILGGGTALAQAATDQSPSATADTIVARRPRCPQSNAAAFKKDMDALRTERDAVLAKYGLKAPARGERGDLRTRSLS